METALIFALGVVAGGLVARLVGWIQIGPGIPVAALRELYTVLEGGAWAPMDHDKMLEVVTDAQTLARLGSSVTNDDLQGERSTLFYDLQTLGQAHDGLATCVRHARGVLANLLGEDATST